MALAKRPRESTGNSSRKVARNQLNLTLSDDAMRQLESQRKRLRIPGRATLAKELLEHALAERASHGAGEAQGLEELRAEVRALRRAHYNAVLKILSTAGRMSREDVEKWATKWMK